MKGKLHTAFDAFLSVLVIALIGGAIVKLAIALV